MSRRGEAYIQIRRGEAGTVLYSRIAIEPHRFDREVRGRGRVGSRPAHARRACDRHDPAPVSRDLHNPRPPRDGAGLLPRAPDRKRRGLESNRCGNLPGRLRTPALAIDSAGHPVGRIRRVPAVARATFAISHLSLRERDRAAPGRRRGWRLPVIGLAAAFGLFFALLLEPIPSDFGFLDFLIVGLNLLFLPFVDAQVIWNYVATVWGVHRIGREALRLRPAVEDPMIGLRPLGSLSLGATFYFFGALAIIMAEVTLSPDPVRPAYLVFLIVLVLFGAGLLFLPLVSIHRLMVAEKRRAIDTASSRVADVYA